MFIASRENGDNIAMICKYILNDNFLFSGFSTDCVKFTELTNPYEVLVPYQENIFMVTYEIASPYWTNFILYDFDSNQIKWKNRIMNDTQGSLNRPAMDYDPVDGLIYSWHVHSQTSDLLMFILNATNGSQHGTRYIKSQVKTCLHMFYYDKSVYGIVFSEYSLDNVMLLIVADVSDPNSVIFTTYQQVPNNPMHCVFVDPTTQRVFVGI